MLGYFVHFANRRRLLLGKLHLQEEEESRPRDIGKIATRNGDKRWHAHPNDDVQA